MQVNFNGNAILAPMVGTFYRALPGETSGVAVGDTVLMGQVVGAIAAMGLSNPIKARATGTITAILVADGTWVEYGQPLMLLNRPLAKST